ncbi:MAG: AAA family ATPase, partial [Cyanobacteriota bacterium]|nr:AAA family ATPase [Cyanobacteriota bacterium]
EGFTDYLNLYKASLYSYLAYVFSAHFLRLWLNNFFSKPYIDFQTPIKEVAAVRRRDAIQHPFFEEIYNWSSSLRYYQFGTDLGRNRIAVINSSSVNTIKKQVDFKDTEQVIGIFKIGKEELGDNFINTIKADMAKIGYKVSGIGSQVPSMFLSDEKEMKLEIEPEYLYVKESDLADTTEQAFMSQGMFRALSLIIQINYLLLAEKPSCILIDDIGEGLDFERASAIIQLLISKAETGLVQLIMTTNDRFIMNGVPLDYWSVIERKPGLAKLHNTSNSKDIFDEFKFTGLNNFDFFSTQFYIEGFGEQEAVSQ